MSSPSDMHAPLTKVSASQSSAVRIIVFSNLSQLGADPNFRKAVSKIIKRSSIIRRREELSPTHEILPGQLRGQSFCDPFSPVEARELLNKVSAGLLRQKWRIPVFANGDLTALQKHYTGQLAHQFHEFGLDVEFFPHPEKFLSADLAKGSPFRLTARVIYYVNPLVMFGAFQSAGSYKSDHPVGDEKEFFDQLYQSAERANSCDERNSLLREISRFVADSALAVAVGEEKSIHFYNPLTIKSLGLQNDPLSLSLDKITLHD